MAGSEHFLNPTQRARRPERSPIYYSHQPPSPQRGLKESSEPATPSVVRAEEPGQLVGPGPASGLISPCGARSTTPTSRRARSVGLKESSEPATPSVVRAEEPGQPVGPEPASPASRSGLGPALYRDSFYVTPESKSDGLIGKIAYVGTTIPISQETSPIVETDKVASLNSGILFWNFVKCQARAAPLGFVLRIPGLPRVRFAHSGGVRACAVGSFRAFPGYRGFVSRIPGYRTEYKPIHR